MDWKYRPVLRDGSFLPMKQPYKTALFITMAAAALMLSSCATTDDEYQDDQEYSNMPWNTPQQWEGSRSIPGLGGGGGGGY